MGKAQMKTILRIISFIAIFLISLNFGFHVGASDAPASNAPEAKVALEPTAELSDTVHTFVGGNQRNIMAIGIHREGDNDPQLEGIWLIVYFSDSPEVDLISFFPAITEDKQSINEELASSFSLTPEGEPNDAFWKEMEARNILFHNYVVFDMDALWEITQIMQVDDEYATGLPTWKDDYQAALSGQTQLLEQLCGSFTEGNLIDSIYPFLKNLGSHMNTNLAEWQIEADWHLLTSFSAEMNCVFPNLTTTPY